jgi:hypothetical protein
LRLLFCLYNGILGLCFNDWRLCYYWLNYWLYGGYYTFGSGFYGRGDGNRRLDPDSLFF